MRTAAVFIASIAATCALAPMPLAASRRRRCRGAGAVRRAGGEAGGEGEAAAAALAAADAAADAAEDAADMREIFASGADLRSAGGDDETIDVGSVFDAEDMRQLFAKAADDAPKAKKTGSLNDLDDVSFKMLMYKRLGQLDFDRIFKSPRVDWDIK